ncbi:MAG: hypothetical protein EXS14_10760 [Planctomycetes bacterium]|nr:hypothetical protein [Planctomycetota bacterium]
MNAFGLKMIEPPRSSAFSRACALLFCALLLSACPRDSAVTVDSAAESLRRQQESKALFYEAEARIVPEKVALYRKLLAHYPESEEAPMARMKLVFYLRDPAVARHDEALSAAITFSQLCPGDIRASECFRWLDSDAGQALDVPRRSAVQAAWKTHLDAAAVAAASLTPIEKMSLWLERADLARRSRDPATALRFYDEALAFEAARQDLYLRVHFEKGRIEAEDPALHAAARVSFEKALVLARAGVKGATESEIHAHLAAIPR